MEPEQAAKSTKSRNNPQKEQAKASQLTKELIDEFILHDRNLNKQDEKLLLSGLPITPFAHLVGLVKSCLDSREKLERSAKLAHVVVMKAVDYRIDYKLLTAFFVCLKTPGKQLGQFYNYKQLQKLVVELPLSLLPLYYQLFGIKDPEYRSPVKLLKALLKQKEKSAAKTLIEITKDKQLLTLAFESQLIPKKFLVSIAAKRGLGKKDFLKINQNMLYASFRYFCRDSDSDRLEQVFADYPFLLAQVVRKALTNNQRHSAASICERNPEIYNFLSHKHNTLIQNTLESYKGVLLPNILRTDKFEPSDPQKFLKFTDFQMSEKEIIIVNTSSFRIQELVEAVQNATELGIDTESIVARTSFDKEEELLSIIQVATKSKVFIFDAQIRQNQSICKLFAEFFSDKQKKIIGHTVKQDFGLTCRGLGVKDEPHCEIVDVVDIFMKKFPDERKSLANICLVVLQKPLCKQYTLTNWNRRPLLLNQIHYAALDAFIVLILHEKLLSK